MSRVAFTGERLHEGDDLFGVDILRHRAAYAFAARRAAERAGRGRVLDLGCGSGYGVAELSRPAQVTVGLDRIPPDSRARDSEVLWVRGEMPGIPLTEGSFDLVVSFQVVEHLEDPTHYLNAIARLLRPGGVALLSTPNLLQSDRENPFHVHEYAADELSERLERHFESVEMLGVGASPPVARYYDARLERIRTIVRLDPLRLRHRIPRWLVDWLFAKLAVIVRRSIQQSEGLPDATLEDFPIAPADDRCLDLLAVCRDPKGGGNRT